MLPVIISSAVLGWTLYSVVSLLGNIRRAQKSASPFTLSLRAPSTHSGSCLSRSSSSFWIAPPFEFGRVNHYGRRTWRFMDKAQSHLRMGDAWAVVTPSEVFVYICDAEATTDILARRSDFVRPLELYTLLNVFGPNVATTAGSNWQRHRKILAAPFNEGMSGFVWREAILQAQGMLMSRTKTGSSGGLGTDTRTIALIVLAATGFKRSTPFKSTLDAHFEDPRSYAESLRTVMLNTFVIMLIPPSVLKMPFLPSWCRCAGQAVEDFKQHMLNMFDTEKALLKQGKPGTSTLMSSFVRELIVDAKSSKTVLTLDKILGNIYIINFARHDTTGGTLAYMLFLLAAFPDVQEWIAEEVRIVLCNPNKDTWEYKKSFPRLK